MSKAFKKYVVIHGHFYQPPRENPWLDYIEQQYTAFPAHDWNERIAWECYNPNGIARINDKDGKVVDLINNYKYMNFNFGPTLLKWYEKRLPEHYKCVTDAAKDVKEQTGFSNAIAQAYNHTILPLSDFKDSLTQVLWGLADFKFRFGFNAEALWLPETACNAATLKLLIDQGMKYVILSPTQAKAVRRMGSQNWIDVSDNSIDSRRPYVWLDKDEKGEPLPKRSIAVFFYDGNLSKSIAFEDVMKDSYSAGRRFLAAFNPAAQEDQIVSVAADGETFGHHRKFADLTLAHLFSHEFPANGIEVTSYAKYLEAHPPQWEAEIKKGDDNTGTAWSCSHGVNRWRGGCLCGADDNSHTQWRAPLRSALNEIAQHIDKVYEKEAGKYFTDVWQARNKYIDVMLDNSLTDRFLKEQTGGKQLEEQERLQLIKLLEMQKYKMFMFTSCGWFFSDISRIEAVQNLKYAAKAVEIAETFGEPGLEQILINRLEFASSNWREFKNGADVYKKLVQPSKFNSKQILAQYALSQLVSVSKEKSSLYFYDIVATNSYRRMVDAYTFAAGTLKLKNRYTGEKANCVYCSIISQGAFPRAYISFFNAPEKFAAIKKFFDSVTVDTVWQGLGSEVESIIDKQPYTLHDLIPEVRRDILINIYELKLQELRATNRRLFSEYMPLIEQWHGLDLEVPKDIMSDTEICSRQYVSSALEQFQLTRDISQLDNLESVVPRIINGGIKVVNPELESTVYDTVINEFRLFRESPSYGNAKKILKLISIAQMLGVKNWIVDAQDYMVSAFKQWKADGFSVIREYCKKERETVTVILQVYELLRIAIKDVITELSQLR